MTFLGIEWHMWKVIGWMGNAVFTSRFLVQWYATEKHKQVTVPAAFWWLSLLGSLLLLSYAVFHEKDSVFIFAYLFPWLVATRNLIIHYRHKKTQKICAVCHTVSPTKANFCMNCGIPVAGPQVSSV
ncbi:MAG: putative rane protein [Verrucomicrobiales bacterium]|nr:putative rane protein [Verrucomicrobiales bacterium]MDB6131668.1 putative rane protein [Verrucomicrobiales bacterium]